MRPVQLADIEIAARVLLQVAPEARLGVMQDMIQRAEAADRFRTATKRTHPQFGTGTLMSSAAHWQQAPRPAALGADALQAYSVVLAALLANASHQSS